MEESEWLASESRAAHVLHRKATAPKSVWWRLWTKRTSPSVTSTEFPKQDVLSDSECLLKIQASAVMR
ncbi:hypothetical protein PGT21_008824 [Puccinia graminis f. sp. tritici]|uniref:Uncharacterized protein n=1 Tax=Puccinia graminis f. sp. tritici TaxID=56615 RepID=A0A5B0M0Q2_PUCGR|nr:hypothetical protein PGT21_008824 [Puccinia graminis f. sp. tritici]KAA1090070.1 hypothetical protein PGTUg99_035036 [Puccinia graminis f. sp. tritici]